MAKEVYRVFAEVTTMCYLDVEANSAGEAERMGQDADGGDFISIEEGGEFIVKGAEKKSELK